MFSFYTDVVSHQKGRIKGNVEFFFIGLYSLCIEQAIFLCSECGDQFAGRLIVD